MKIYVGKRWDGIAKVLTSSTGDEQNLDELDPARSLKLRNHSPTGFEWGYGGSGPAQLALAILLDSFGAELALAEYQQFKAECVCRMPPEGNWVLTEQEISNWIGDREKMACYFRAKWDGARSATITEEP
jgi:hypothetical protein